jgi:ABC-type uncharacterized transport system involved in gliding motility auxiliary subunit
MTRKSMALTALALAAALFVAVNVLAQSALRHARLDLTREGLYTLTPGTLNIIRSVQEPVTLRLFFSESLASQVPAVRTYGQRVRELLEEYRDRSEGRIRLEVVDPEAYSDAEDRAVEAGVKGVPLDRSSGRQFYFGLVGTNSTDRQEVIPFFQQDREAFLEYDLTRLVYSLSGSTRPVVGVLTDIPLEYGPGGVMAAMRGGGGQPYAVLSMLRGVADVRMLKSDLSVVDDDIGVLLVARPKSLPDRAQYAIDQFVMKGGHAVFLVDPLVESGGEAGMGGMGGMGGMPGMPDPDEGKAALLPRLFDAWGIVVEPGKVVADPQIAMQIDIGQGARRRVAPYPVWLGLGDEQRDRGDVVTADLNTIIMASAGSLSLKPGATATLTPLLTTSAAGQTINAGELGARPEPERLLARLKPEGSRLVLAARIGGTVKTAFPDGPPPAPEAGETPPAHRAASTGPVNLIVVADSDFIEDRFWVDDQNMLGQRVLLPTAANGDLLVNAVENLTGSADLIGLRGRAVSARPFTLVERLRRAAGEQVLVREQELRGELDQAERQLADLQGKARPGASALLSTEEQSAIDRFRAQALRIRKELRDVQHALNRDIERVAASVKLINIAVVPLAVAAGAAGLALWRTRRRRAAVAGLSGRA